MKNWSKYIIGLLVIISCAVSMWLPTLPNISISLGIILGMGLGILISFLIPNLWKSFLETVSAEHQEAIEQKRYIGINEVLTHPTHLPVTLGGIWFILNILLTLILEKNLSQKLPSIIAFTPIFLSFGFSGLSMFKRKEIITGGWFGYQVKKSNWAIVLGTFAMLIGFGGSIYYVMAIIFNW